MKLSVVILAAGQGTRMKSSLPKVLHPIAGKPMLMHIIETSRQLHPVPTQLHIIYGKDGNLLKAACPMEDVHWVEQHKQLGTGHAVLQALPYINDDEKVLILYGDVPLLSVNTIQALLENAVDDALGLITAEPADPTGLGRVLRDGQGKICAIIEHKDASEDQLKIQEVFTGIMVVSARLLKQWLPTLNNRNIQKEYYLPDIVACAMADNYPIYTYKTADSQEVQGVNDLHQLLLLERAYQYRSACTLLKQGILIADPTRFDLRGTLTAGKDNRMDINVIIEGNVTLGNNVKIGMNTFLRNVVIGNNVTIKPNCVIEDSFIEADCQVGPFAHLRPGSHLEEDVKIGNFVEIKNTRMGIGSKAAHLSYLGDAKIGKNVNIGAGTITCNYDGVNKHSTSIGDQASIGANSSLIAPLHIGEGAMIGAGSTITKDPPPYKLTLSRAKQQTVEGWSPPKKKDK